MQHDSCSLYNSEIFNYSDSDVSSFGSSESDNNQEEFELDNIQLSSNQFFKFKTPGISNQVLNFDNNKLDEAQKIENNFSHNNQDMQSSEPKLIKDLIEIKQIGNKLHIYHQEIENSLSELKKSKNQLYELEKLNKEHDNTKELIKEIEKQPINIYKQIETANSQLDGVQKQLFNFFDEFNLDEMKINGNQYPYSKMLEKAKEITDCIETSLPLFSEEVNNKNIQKQESFESLCQHVDVIISEMNDIGKKLDELLNI